EQVMVQWVLAPMGPVAPVRAAVKPAGGRPLLAQLLADMIGGRQLEGKDLALAQAKQSSALFAAVGRVGVGAGRRDGGRRLVGQVLAAHHTVNAPGAHLYRRRLPAALMCSAIATRRRPTLHFPCTLNATELAALVAFPVETVTLPGLRLAGCRQLAAAADIPS